MRWIDSQGVATFPNPPHLALLLAIYHCSFHSTELQTLRTELEERVADAKRGMVSELQAFRFQVLGSWDSQSDPLDSLLHCSPTVWWRLIS